MSAIPTHITFDSLAKSGMPSETKTAIRRWYDRAVASGREQDPMAIAKLHARAAGQVVRQGGESVLVGGIIGAIHSQMGTLDVKKVPVDAVAGVLGMAASVVLINDEFAVDLRNAGATATGIYSYRKVKEFMDAKKKSTVRGEDFNDAAHFNGPSPFRRAMGIIGRGKSQAHGDIGEDPIVAMGRRMG